MHKTAVGYAIGKLMQIMGAALLAPLAVGIYDHFAEGLLRMLSRPEMVGYLVAILLLEGLGTAAVLHFRSGRELQGVREGFAIVGIGWVALTFFSAIPLFAYLASLYQGEPYAVIRAFTDAYFELMSGFTTTGATILTNIEATPRSLLFLRALAHWLGGMGIITLALVIFPGMGVTAYQMFRSEVPGPSKDKLAPRLSQTTSILWGVYGLLTAAEIVLLMVGGMSLFDAVCHAFATMATGGFSTMNASVAAYDSDFIRWVIIIFMYFAGINFLLHFKVLRGGVRGIVADREWLFYTSVIAVAVAVTTVMLYIGGPAPFETAADQFRHAPMTESEFAIHYYEHAAKFDDLYETFRHATFQVVSIVTTTGFVTTDFDIWPNILRFLLVLLMFFGGCAGSTGGGIKMVRVLVLFKVMGNELKKRAQPRLVVPVKIGEKIVDDRQVVNILSFAGLFVGLFVVVAMLMSMFVPDLVTAFACSIATIANIGPGLAGVGAVEHYAWIPVPGKWVLIVSMLLGRLEIFTVLILFRPSVWRK